MAQRGWRTFLKPGWVITAILVIAFAYVAFTVLAPWQLGKNSRTQATNHRLEKAFHADPVPLSKVITKTASAPTGTIDESNEWKRVRFQGSFLADEELVLRNRPVNSDAAYQILTPFRTDDGTVIMVNRGYVRPESGSRIPSFSPPPSGRVAIQGYVRLDEPAPEQLKTTHDDGYTEITNLSSSWYEKEIPQEKFVHGYVQLEDNQPGTLNAIPLPQLDSGPYLSYGIQWITFGILAPLGLGYFAWAEIRERRKAREEEQEYGALGDEDITSNDTPTTDEAADDDRNAGESAAISNDDAEPDEGAYSQKDAGSLKRVDPEESRETPSKDAPPDRRRQNKPSSSDDDTADEDSAHEDRAGRDSQPEPTYQQDLYDTRYGGTKRRNAFAQRLKKDQERF
ncbi:MULTISPECIES: SURF1 family protein [Corynebacterium]|uniref:SURF1 family cytochrome oxidase biogenesis protein n=1 Tax=Corynebacterium TaxID=1716 RepID=UPI0019589B30|nr:MULTISPECIES: SURF1 family cytochrome oxidase biogenesis protein [Corynebacterium]MDN8625127.1 SURF1 family cytochrome oxidase biogenesis protein [Corynebacterium kroppenstedtii]QRQ64878.1 SURF1 family protein [Corynebacterium kroppenstedtii]